MQTLKEEMRNNILKAAESEFLKNGKEAATMRTIATQAGMTAANMYHYYKGKDALYRAVCENAEGTRKGDLLKVCELVSTKGIVWALKKLPDDELKRMAGKGDIK